MSSVTTFKGPFMSSATPATFLSLQELFARHLPGYRRRPQQEHLAQAIELTLTQDLAERDPMHLLAEAGTGTGKSYAALVAAILASRAGGEARKRFVVATATNALLTQYVKKDLPWLEEVLGEVGIDFTWAPLKGISNFACLAKLADRPTIANLQQLLDELAPDENGQRTHTGDRDDITTPIDQRREWPLASASSDECPGRGKCSFAEQCFGLRHKEAAMDADIVATNLAVLLTDTKIARETAGDDGEGPRIHVLLGGYDGLIIDEAHELEDQATAHLGFDIKQGGLLKWADQAMSFLAVHEGVDEQRVGKSYDAHQDVVDAIDALTQPIADQLEYDRTGAIDADFISYHADKFVALWTALEALRQRVIARKIADSSNQEREEAIRQRVITTGRNFLANIKAVLLADPNDMVRWAEMYGHERMTVGKRWMIKAAPIAVGSYLREELWSRYPAVLMSATLSAGTGEHRFDYIARRLGLKDTAATLDVGSPFDYKRQALTFHPDKSVPPPAGSTRSEWESWVAAATLELVRAAGGGALLLYTSRRAMTEAYEILGSQLRGEGLNCFVQGGDMSVREMAQRFRDDEHSVLFGLRSFMTGMDFPGDTCFPAGTLVRTDKGYRPIEDLKPGDRVWTHKRRYRKIVATSERPYKGDLVGVTPTGGDEVFMTPNHPVLISHYGRGKSPGADGKSRIGRSDRKKVSLDWIDAGDITTDTPLALPVGEANVRTPTKPMGVAWKSGHTRTAARDGVGSRSTWDDTPSFWELVGIYTAEGHVGKYTEKLSKGGGRGRTYREVVFSFGAHEKDTLARRTCDLIEEVFGSRVNPRVVGSGCVVSLKHTGFGMWLEKNVGTGSHDKRIAWRLAHHPDPKAKESFLEGWVSGDGHQPKNWSAVSAATVSVQLAHGARDLANSLGYTTTLHHREVSGNSYKEGAKYYAVTWGESQRKQSNVAGRYVVAKPQKVRRVEFDGPVYNIEVETDNSYTLPGFGVHNCRLVVVDKLPFAVPTDPIHKARADAIERQGGSAFADLVVPSMTLTLLQAYGRLIRSTDDSGVVAIMDPRLASKGYGRGIVKALPPAPVTTALADVVAFYQGLATELPAAA